MGTVMLVEDDKLLQNALRKVLEDAGYEVIEAISAEEAFKLLQEVRPGIIFMDIVIPGEVDGFQLLKLLKADDKYKTIPVIMLTNLEQINQMDRALEIGALDYVIKANTELSQVVDLVDKHISV